MKNDIIEEAKKRALKDTKGMDIQTTAEGRSFLSFHFNKWFKKLTKGGCPLHGRKNHFECRTCARMLMNG